MQKVILSLLVLFITVTGCRKSGNNSRMFEGKVVRINCATFVVEILSADNIGQDNWLDYTTNKHHDNAIAVDNKCEMPVEAVEGKIIRFTIDSAGITGGCFECKMFDSPPSEIYILKNVTVKN